MQTLEQFNALPSQQAEDELLKCCGSQSWARRLVAARPFQAESDLIRRAEDVWWSLGTQDWLEAFSAHPKIGEKKAERQTSQTAAGWSAQEQAGVADAQAQTRFELMALNKKYEEKFGFIFIVCATGKSSGEMLALLKERLNHTRDVEMRIAAEEQAKITTLRINKLINQ